MQPGIEDEYKKQTVKKSRLLVGELGSRVPLAGRVECIVYYVGMLRGYCIVASVLLLFVCGAYSMGKSSLQYA
jgi:hypothetical protein